MNPGLWGVAATRPLVVASLQNINSTIEERKTPGQAKRQNFFAFFAHDSRYAPVNCQ